jgi:hypothetical protein
MNKEQLTEKPKNLGDNEFCPEKLTNSKLKKPEVLVLDYNSDSNNPSPKVAVRRHSKTAPNI